jgi:hypothetical protein
MAYQQVKIQQFIIINKSPSIPLRQLADSGSGAPCRQFGFAGYFLSINFLTMRELKEVLTKKVLAFLLPINREVGEAAIDYETRLVTEQRHQNC